VESQNTIKYFEAISNDQIKEYLEDCNDQELSDLRSAIELLHAEVEEECTKLKPKYTDILNRCEEFSKDELWDYYQLQQRFIKYTEIAIMITRIEIARMELQRKEYFGKKPSMLLIPNDERVIIFLWYNERLYQYRNDSFLLNDAMQIARFISDVLGIPKRRVKIRTNNLKYDNLLPLTKADLIYYANDVTDWVIEVVKPKNVNKKVQFYYEDRKNKIGKKVS
jgi:hypothetical protein